ncbi:MAG TPA: autotransporter-associated beta strand repeat-containing protein, partial [Methylomirabilota bacterium]|nr:autotransporter-associated beta strand repeat-containing protein [Methylomirabilota bacterium]
VLIFPPGTETFVTNDVAGLVVDQIQISGTNYLLQGTGAGNTLTILGSGPFQGDFLITGAGNTIAASLGLVLSNTVSFSVPTNKTFTIKSVLSGAGGVDKTGPGTLAFQTAGLNNTYSGLTTVRNGLLLLNNASATAVPGNLTIGEAGGTAPCEVRYGSAFGVGNGSAVTVYTNGDYNLFGFNDTIGSLNLYGGQADTGGGTLGLNGDVTSTGYAQLYGVVSFGAITRTFNNINGGLYVAAQLLGNSPGTGLNKVGAGYLDLANTNRLDGLFTVGAGSLFLDHSGALGTTNSGTVVSNGAAISLSSFITVTGEALTIQGNGDPTWGAFSLGLASSWAGNVSLAADTLVSTLSGTPVISGAITGAGKLIKTGAGNLQLAGAQNNFNSGVEVRLGGLYLNKNNNLDCVIGTLVIGTPGGETGDAWVTAQNYNMINDFTAVTIYPSGSLNIGIYGTYIGSLEGAGALNLSTGQLTVGLNAQNTTFSGPISGTGATNILKSGPGTLNLTGASTVSGKMAVLDGKVAINAAFNSMPVVIAGAGTLSGTGAVASVTAESGGTLAPGNSPGQLSILGPLTMQAGSIYSVELNGLQAGSTFDQVAVAGPVTLGNATLQATLGLASAVSNVFTIVLNYSAGAVSGTFNGLPNNSTLTLNNRKFRVRYNGGSGNEVTLTQEDTAPAINTLNTPAATPEGSAAHLTGTYSEPDTGDAVSLVVNWGDGSTTTNSVSGGAFNVTHIYVDDNPSSTPQDSYSINAYPIDSFGAIGVSQLTSVLITNVPPTFTVPAGIGVLPGQPIAATIAISDPGADTFQAQVDYGAGGGFVTVPVANNLFNLDYTYPSNGTYNVTILVHDDDMGQKQQSFAVLVGVRLSIADAGSQVKLSWPSAAQNLFVVHDTTLTGTNWVVLPASPILNGAEYYINVPKTNPASFFRLGWDPNAQ